MRWKFAAAVLLLAAQPLFAKSLSWAELIVNARLDSDGRMHVQERQAIIFDGDWNGGERTFNLRPGQVLDFRGISRVDNGREVPLVRGDLSQVDHWDFTAPGVIRWRSRLPADPPFQHRAIVYVLDYVLSNILEQLPDGQVRLQHDFAFPNRAGDINDYALFFQIDPAWSGLQSPVRISRRNLAPGQSVVVSADLTYTGAGKPAAVHIPPPVGQMLILPIFMVIAGILLTIFFYSAEARKGLFRPLVPPSVIDEQWLQQNIFSLPPEAVGTAWDESTGAHEVAAFIARMAQEKKITTSVTEAGEFAKKPVLNMRLEVDWKTLPEAEQELVKALFLGQTETDTVMIAQHYRSTGFQPQSLIKDSINAALAKVPEWHQSDNVVSPAEIFVALFTLIFAVVAFGSTASALSGLLIGATILMFIGIGFGFWVRRSAQLKSTAISLIVAWIILLLVATACYFGAQMELSPLFLVPAAFAAIGAAALVLLVSRSRDSIAKLAFRRRLGAARQYFQSQLRLRNPNLRDAWYPYIVALGLGPNVDQWFHAFPQTSHTMTIFPDGSSPATSGGSSSSAWTGGGSSFGGAGAGGSWAAMSALAGGVAAPSSGGGGGGGGGGSGGGGGGGW